ncbi:MAG TPA: enoyl-CoA hydratase/isomerase family protein [Anaerolineaceae bacterium]|nr:enoyl-CoA hydratase/isomerase family protein [Anaerolineaceae bacterium]
MASVELKKLGHTVLLTLNRSEVLNALNLDFVREIHAALDEIEKDNDLYVPL